MEAWLSIPMMKESESTVNFFGLLRMSEGLADERAEKAVQMNLRCILLFGYFLTMWTVCPLLLGVMYHLQRRVWLCVY